jgi:hypothetical protein
MGYFIDNKGNYPRHAGDVQLEHPDWQEGVDSLPEGWQEVAEGVLPEVDAEHKLVELAPAEVDGVLTRQFSVEPLTAQELADLKLATIRNKVAAGLPLTKDEAALLVA